MNLKQLFQEADRHTTIVLLGAGVLLALYMGYGSPAFAARVLDRPADDVPCALWLFCSSLLVLGLGPVLLCRFVLKRPLAEIGITLGDWRYTAKVLAICLPIVTVLLWVSSHDPEIRAEYPLARGLGPDLGVLLLYEAAFLLYYIGWEVFFRGWLLLGLSKQIGAFPAVGLSMLVSTAVHYGKPAGEIWAAVVGGIVLGWFVLRVGSILGAFVAHAVVGVLTDLFVTFGTGSLR